MHCVIGSGPAGVACTKALLARGATVLMLDAGLELESDRARIVRQFADAKPSAWQTGDHSSMRSVSKNLSASETDTKPVSAMLGIWTYEAMAVLTTARRLMARSGY